MLQLRSAVHEQELLLEIRDNGIGMSPEVRRRLFEPFFSTKDVAHGTGLGLAIAHGIIRRHHGRILVESQPGVGTKFSIYLPIT
jgi:two-component system NtrC family sensor kinase